MLGNTLEALIGAVYIDKGFKKCKKFVLKNIVNHYIDLEEISETDLNYKGRLIDWAQKNKKDYEFVCIEETAKTKSGRFYKAKLKINGTEISCGKAECKKEAEQMAAQKALQIINKEN